MLNSETVNVNCSSLQKLTVNILALNYACQMLIPTCTDVLNNNSIIYKYCALN